MITKKRDQTPEMSGIPWMQGIATLCVPSNAVSVSDSVPIANPIHPIPSVTIIILIRPCENNNTPSHAKSSLTPTSHLLHRRKQTNLPRHLTRQQQLPKNLIHAPRKIHRITLHLPLPLLLPPHQLNRRRIIHLLPAPTPRLHIIPRILVQRLGHNIVRWVPGLPHEFPAPVGEPSRGPGDLVLAIGILLYGCCEGAAELDAAGFVGGF